MEKRPYDSKIEFAFSKEFFEKYKAEAMERYEGTDEGTDEGYAFEVKAQMQEINIDKNQVNMSFLDKESVWCSMRYSIEGDIWEYLAELCIKKFNKLKAILQGAA